VSRVVDLELSSGSHYQRLNDLESLTAQQTIDISSNAVTIGFHTTTLGVHTSSINANTSNLATETGRINTNIADIANLDGDVTALDARVTTNESDIVTLDADITAAQGDISTLQSQVSTLISDLAAHIATVHYPNGGWVSHTFSSYNGLLSAYFETLEIYSGTYICRMASPGYYDDTATATRTTRWVIPGSFPTMAEAVQFISVVRWYPNGGANTFRQAKVVFGTTNLDFHVATGTGFVDDNSSNTTQSLTTSSRFCFWIDPFIFHSGW
jgi:uncharacterized coiled-coil protein SlyX